MMSIDARYDQPGMEDAYMSSEQINFFRQRLLRWRDQLLRDKQAAVCRIRTNEDQGGDLIDRSVKDSNKLMDFISRRRNEETIRKIDAALRRIEDGSYGYCLESGEEIGIRRLLAYPIATLSVEAQELLETRRKLHERAVSTCVE